MKLVDTVCTFLIVVILAISFISGIIALNQTYSETILPMLVNWAVGAAVSLVIWLIKKLVLLALTYITDIHYYSRTQMEVALEAAGIELAEPQTEVAEPKAEESKPEA